MAEHLLEIIYGVDLSPYKLQFHCAADWRRNRCRGLYALQYPYRYPLGKMPASGLFRHRSYYHRSCPDSGAAVGNYGRSIELCTVLLHFVCAVYFDSDLCNSSKKTSELMSD